MPTPPTTSIIAQAGHPPAGGWAAAAGSCLGLERDPRCQRAGLAALKAAPTTPEALEQALATRWGLMVAVAPVSAIDPVAVLLAVGHAGDAMLVAPALAARHRRGLEAAVASGHGIEVAPADEATLLETLRARNAAGQRVWYAADTLDARTGERAPLEALWALHDDTAGLHLLLDDTHGMGWCGQGGRGLAIGGAPADARLVVLADLSRGPGAELGVIASPDAALVEAARPAFEARALGPVRLGAALGMAELSPAEWEALQGRLQKRMQLADRLMRAHGLPRLGETALPVQFVSAHAPAVAYAVVGRLLEGGHAVSATTVTTPDGPQAAIRFALSLAQPLEALQGLLEALAQALPGALEAAGTSLDDLRRAHGGAGVTGPATMIDMAAWRASRLSDSRGAR